MREVVRDEHRIMAPSLFKCWRPAWFSWLMVCRAMLSPRRWSRNTLNNAGKIYNLNIWWAPSYTLNRDQAWKSRTIWFCLDSIHYFLQNNARRAHWSQLAPLLDHERSSIARFQCNILPAMWAASKNVVPFDWIWVPVFIYCLMVYTAFAIMPEQNECTSPRLRNGGVATSSDGRKGQRTSWTFGKYMPSLNPWEKQLMRSWLGNGKRRKAGARRPQTQKGWN